MASPSTINKIHPKVLTPLRVNLPFNSVYVWTVILCAVMVTAIYYPFLRDFSVPLGYAGDSLFVLSMIKTVLIHGWYWINPDIGAPGGHQLFDYPMCVTTHWLLIKVIGIIAHDPIITCNIFYYSMFFAIALTAVYALKTIGVSDIVAMTASLLFTFIPFHQLRGVGHLFLTSYYCIPLAVLICYWMYTSIGSIPRDAYYQRWPFDRKRTWQIVVFALIVASTGLYYCLFTLLFLALISIWIAMRTRHIDRMIAPAIVIMIMIFSVVVQYVPSLWYHYTYGKNPTAVIRHHSEPEVYGLKIIQLLLPHRAHRIPAARAMFDLYRNTAPLVNENQDASLGFVAAIGFVYLLGCALFQAYPTAEIRMLVMLLLGSILYATIGGFISLQSYIIGPFIRGGNRICVFISYFSLMALAIMTDRIVTKIRARYPRYIVAVHLCVLLVLFVGLFDQTFTVTPQFVERISNTVSVQKAFIRHCEAELPAGSMVFQLPYLAYPEAPGPYELVDYGHFRAYLHSQQLRWSYGAMKGRPVDTWYKHTSNFSGKQLLDAVTKKGFSAVYIDRSGYADRGKQVEAQIASVISAPPIVSRDGKLVCYILTPSNRNTSFTKSSEAVNNHDQPSSAPRGKSTAAKGTLRPPVE